VNNIINFSGILCLQLVDLDIFCIFPILQCTW